MKTINISTADIALILSFFGVVVSLWNVTRQQKASLKNDEMKFIRELKLKTSDEFIEILYNMMLSIGSYRSMNFKYDEVLLHKNIDKTKEFNEYLWSLTQEWGISIKNINAYYLRRRKLLFKYDNQIIGIINKSKELDNLLWKTKGLLFQDEYDSTSIEPMIVTMQELANDICKEIENLIILIQQDFLKNMV